MYMDIPEIDFGNSTWSQDDWQDFLVQTTKFNQSKVIEKLNETLRGSTGLGGVPSSVGLRPSWRQLISDVRSSPVALFWEIFAGCAILTSKMREHGWHCGPPIDVVYDDSFNLLDTFFVTVIIGLIMEGRFALIHIAPPCSSFSRAVNRFVSHAMRSSQFPAGLPGLNKHQNEKVLLGNALALVALRIAEVQEKAKTPKIKRVFQDSYSLERRIFQERRIFHER